MSMLLDIAGFHAAYIRAIDQDDLERWPDFFADPSFYRITTAANVAEGLEAGVVYADSHGMLRDRITALRRANIYERQRYRHIVGLPALLDTPMRAETPFLVARVMHDGKTDLFATGVYRDEFVTMNGALKLARRDVILDSTRIDTLLAIPL
jgi:3-phenylpropionate/cinnamic acid dioxygenase small subunit